MGMINARLIERELLTSDLGIFKFEADNELKFKAGQFNTLNLQTPYMDESLKRPRALSIVSSPSKSPEIEYYIRLVREGGQGFRGRGEMTTSLFSLNYADLEASNFLMSDRAFGKMYKDEGDSRKVIRIGTGTGLAPFVSQIRYAMENGESLKGDVLIHGVAYCGDLGYREELEDRARDSGFNYLHVQSRTKCDSDSVEDYVGEWFFKRDESVKGRIDLKEIERGIEEGRHENPKIERILGEKLTPDKYFVMVVGHPDVANNVTRMLEAHDFVAGKDVISEKYWASKKGDDKFRT